MDLVILYHFVIVFNRTYSSNDFGTVIYSENKGKKSRFCFLFTCDFQVGDIHLTCFGSVDWYQNNRCPC